MSTSSFRTIRASNPRFEQNGLRHLTVKSSHLKGRGDITLYVPEIEEEGNSIPLVILLHGVYGSHWAWAYRGGAHLTADRLIKEGKIQPMILAMPSDGLWGDGSGYVEHQAQNFENWIVDDVPKAVAEVLPFVGTQSPLFISGLSMGGYGALRLGAKYHHKFRAFSGHSSVTHLDHLFDVTEEKMETAILPDEERYVLKIMITNKSKLPPFRFDCGTEDLLLKSNQNLSSRLIEAGIEHTYEEFPGGHEWEYWERYLEKSLLFFQKQLK